MTMTTKEDIFGEPFKNYPYVQLTDSENRILNEFIGELEQRRSPNRDTFKCAVNDAAGFGGELAFSKYYGLDYSLELKEGGDSFDFRVMDSKSGDTGKIDVKTITFGGGDMLIQDSRPLTSDLYFLVEKRGQAYGLIGYARRSEVAQADVYPPGVYSPVQVKRIPREALHESPESDRITETVV